jgi:hypothetical protein
MYSPKYKFFVHGKKHNGLCQRNQAKAPLSLFHKLDDLEYSWCTTFSECMNNIKQQLPYCWNSSMPSQNTHPREIFEQSMS